MNPIFSPEDGKVARALVDVLSGGSRESTVSDFSSLAQLLISKGLDKQLESWITRDENIPVLPEQLETALDGTHLLDVLCKRTNLEKNDVLDRLSFVLPRVVHEVTPFGHDESSDAAQFHLEGLREILRK